MALTPGRSTLGPARRRRSAAALRRWPCFQHVRWDPDGAELRRFAGWMLGGFALLGGLAAWRAGQVGPIALILWGAGVLLAATAILPAIGRLAFLAVYIPSSLIGYVVSHVILGLTFYLVFLPIGLLLRVSGKDLLRVRPRGTNTMWSPHVADRDAASYLRQF